LKLLKQKILYFSEGKSDKVYEVDLCEVGSDLFTVNFRYGRRGTSLREGTKTVFPVSYEEAEKIFEKLVESKEKKGYSENGENKEVIPPIKPEKVNTAREETILKYLKEANLGSYTRNWKVSRIILRTVSLNMTNAAELIRPFVNSKDEFEQYAAIYALAHFKDISQIETILKVFKEKGFENKVGRIAVSFLIKFGTIDDYTEIKEAILLQKPEEVSLTKDVVISIASYLLKNDNIDASILYYAYLISLKDKEVRSRLFDFIQNTPLKVNTFKSVRYIYRTAEITNDIPFLTLLAKRIAISNPVYNSSSWGVYVDNKYVNPSEEKIKKNPKVAFSSNTKFYFNKTAYKLAYNYSKTNTDDYIEYATHLLCSLDDKFDNEREDIQFFYGYDYEKDEHINEKRYFPKYSNFLALMYILYGNSSNINGTNKQYFTQDLKEATSQRIEALPEVWDTKPQALLTVLADAKSDVAINFSLLILKDNPNFLENINEDLLSKLVSHYDERVIEIILPVLKEKYRTKQPEENVLFPLLRSSSEEANSIAFEWLKKYENSYFNVPLFIPKLLLAGKVFIIDYLKELYRTGIAYNISVNLTDISLFFETNTDFNYDYLIIINQLIGETYFGKLLKETTEKEIKSLANSNSVIHKIFAINLAKHNKLTAFQLFKDDFDSYINSDEEILRKSGIEILAHFNNDFLLENQHKISSYCFSEYSEVRGAIQPTIERLLKLDAIFKEKLLNQLLSTIIESEEYDGVHKTSYSILIQYYDKNLPSISKEGIVKLVLSNYDFAQKLGTPLFKERVVLKDFSIAELIELSNSAVLDIRTALHNYFKENVTRINNELEDALKIFNSNWQDVIDWAILYFKESIASENWTIEMLLYVSDHTKTDVQDFGRELIITHSSEDKGLPLLLKLQEHPTKKMQFFVTNYLNTYATDKVEIILQLESFFKTSLFNINTNRATKTRIYSFLKQESIKSEEVAKMTVRLINSVLGTKTMVDNSNNIDVLLEIITAHPNLEVPLTIKSI
jgi:predicted DNA-binding WGR domain protein